jgi:hypothetical protein
VTGLQGMSFMFCMGDLDMWDWLTLPRIVVFSLLVVAREALAIIKGAREV